MKILQVAPLWERVPPPAYGGTEAVVSLLTERLVAEGHDVTLVASGDSETEARLESVFANSLRTAEGIRDRASYEFAHAAHALSLAGDYDIIHNHAGELVASMAHLVGTPMLTTLHGIVPPDAEIVWRRYRGTYNGISRSHMRRLPEFPAATAMGSVYNAIDVDTFPFDDEKVDYLLFLSRISPEKGPLQAIEVARRTGRQLIIAGKVDAVDRAFFEECVQDEIDDDQIVFIGEADAVMKRHLYRKASALLFPLQWEEPFGLVMPEAMACGTPVIALRRGSVPELIVHGKTGFVVDTLEEMVTAVGELPALDARACRDHVEVHFSPQTMTSNYVRLYERMLAAPSARMRATDAVRPTADVGPWQMQAAGP